MVSTTVISIVAIAVSLTTAWFSLFHKGTVCMTRPGTFALLATDGFAGKPKVFLRSLLYTTGKRGHAIEGMFIKLRRSSDEQAFAFWVFGDPAQLTFGSGCYVGPEGREANHHFLLAHDIDCYRFEPGLYTLEVFGTLLSKAPRRLQSVDFTLSEGHADLLAKNEAAGVIYTWDPSRESYVPKLESRPNT